MANFPITPKSYYAFFDKIARNHTDIGHTDDQKQFGEITLSAAPYHTVELKEFRTDIMSKANTRDKFYMALISMDRDEGNYVRNHLSHIVSGGFILVKKVETSMTKDDKRQVLEDAFINGLTVMRFLADFVNAARGKLIMNEKLCNNEPIIAQVSNSLYGYRFNFSFTVRHQILADLTKLGSLTIDNI